MAGIVEQRAAIPHARNIDWIPRKSAITPNKRGAAVLAILVDNEFML